LPSVLLGEVFGFDGGTFVEVAIGVPAIFIGCTAVIAERTGAAGDAGAQSPLVAANM
jgi:hypothetical protein